MKNQQSFQTGPCLARELKKKYLPPSVLRVLNYKWLGLRHVAELFKTDLNCINKTPQISLFHKKKEYYECYLPKI